MNQNNCSLNLLILCNPYSVSATLYNHLFHHLIIYHYLHPSYPFYALIHNVIYLDNAFRQRHTAGAEAIIHQDILPSTTKKYSLAWRRWCNFCKLDSPNDNSASTPFHLTHHQQVVCLLRFLHYLAADLDLSYTNMDSHMTALRHEWKCKFLPVTSFDDPLVLQSRQAYRLQVERQPDLRGACAPLTWDMLHHIVHSSPYSPGTHDHMIAAACLLGFCGLFRISEITYTTDINTHTLQANAIEFQVQLPGILSPSLIPAHLLHNIPYSQILAVRITQHTAKNRSIFDPPAILSFSANQQNCGDKLDLPYALYSWTNNAKFSSATDNFFSLYTKQHRRNLTSLMITTTIRRTASYFGLSPSIFGSHSLRIGGSTHLHALGVPADIIQKAGRWKSLPVSLRYPAQSSASQDRLLSTFRQPSRFCCNDIVMAYIRKH